MTHVAVVVPAADEEERIDACLRAVDGARRLLRRLRPDVTCDVVVVLDRCTDGTADVVAGWRDVRAVRVEHRCVGRARAHGAEVATDGCQLSTTWIANTDADSRVPEQWLVGQVELAEAGADLVLGTVVPDLGGTQLSRWAALHDPADGHPHVHGANLGVRASALSALGGWPPLHTGEDAALAERAVAAGLPVVRTGRLPVRTSARRVGRAPLGFSHFVAVLDDCRPTACD